MTDFLTGNLANSSSGISWKGKFHNQTYLQLQQKLYENNYTSLSIDNYSGLLNGSSKSEDIFLLTRGFCKKITQSNSARYSIQTTGKNFLLIVDPYKISRLTIKEVDNSRFDFGPTNEDLGHYTYDTYDMQCTLNNHNIEDGTNCANYENLNSSFEACVEKKLKEIALQSFGCLPPWFPQQEYFLHNNFKFRIVHNFLIFK